MKKEVSLFIVSLSSLFLINFVSAQFFDSYGYGSFSITELFERFGAENIIYLSLFLIFFAFLFSILNRVGVFRNAYGNPNVGATAVISLCISLLIIYGIYRSGYDFGSLLYGIGFSADSLYPILLILILALAIFLIWKFGFSVFLIVLGALLALTAFFTDIIYEKTNAMIIGGVLFLLGLLLTRWSRGRLMAGGRWAGRKLIGSYDWQKEKDQWTGRVYVLILGVLLIMLGLVLNNQKIILIAGVFFTLIGIWLWARKRPGLYRPLDFRKGYSPVQERRQWRSGNAMMFSGVLLIIFGFVLKAYWGASQTVVYVFAAIGGIFFIIGLIAKIRY